MAAQILGSKKPRQASIQKLQRWLKKIPPHFRKLESFMRSNPENFALVHQMLFENFGALLFDHTGAKPSAQGFIVSEVTTAGSPGCA